MTQIRLRQDTATNWSSSSSITPALGEPCIQTDGEKHFKIGDGTNKFNNLPHFVQSTELGDLDDLTTENKDTFVDAINEIVANGGNKDLSNLTATGENKLQAVKAYASSGEMLQDPDGLSFVKNYAHSTFDVSKFTVVGSPNITNDGIASGFSASNYIKFSAPDVTSKNYKVTTYVLNWNKVASNDQGLISTRILDNDGRTIEILLSGWTGRIILSLGSNGSTTYNIANNVNSNNKLLTDGHSYKIDFVRTPTSYKVLVTDLETNIEEEYINVNSTVDLNSVQNWALGMGTNYTGYIGAQGQIDLKQFSITVDGVEVFSGNKTGIDTIKPDDYTIYPAINSTVTVSEDGIASGFSNFNYIKTNQAIPVDKDFRLEIEYTITQSFLNEYNSHQQYIIGGTYNSSNDAVPVLFEHTSKNDKVVKFTLIVDNNGANQTLPLISSTFNIVLGDEIKAILSRTNGVYKAQYYKNGIQIGNDVTSANTKNLRFASNLILGQYKTNFTTTVCKGSIDLNSFKIYVDGNLVYQPCLKIPYTESKTGSKIVDSIYRNRVADMAEQFGYANYYTLSDTDFTLPQVELYGLIGQRTLRDSYRNGINYWELYSNRDLEQGGSCTSGVEVTFPKPFEDTNYVLSVPYSAKSSTAFTPTQTGDWIAKGKGVL